MKRKLILLLLIMELTYFNTPFLNAKSCEYHRVKAFTFPMLNWALEEDKSQNTHEGRNAYIYTLGGAGIFLAWDIICTFVIVPFWALPQDSYECGAQRREGRRNLANIIKVAKHFMEQGNYREAKQNFEMALKNEYITKSEKKKAEESFIKARKFIEQPPQLGMNLSFTEPSGNGFLDAEETGKIVLSLTNKGKGSAYGVKIQVEAKSKIQGVNYPGENIVGLIASGETKNVEMDISASEEVPSQTIAMLIKCIEESGFDAEPKEIVFQTKAFEPPKLLLADVGVQDSNGNAKVEPGELIEVTARIQNKGTGEALNVLAKLKINSSDVFSHGETERNFSQLKPGEYTDAKFTVFTNTRFQSRELPISIEVSEVKGRYGFKAPLPVSVYQTVRSLEVVEIKGKEAPTVQVQSAPSLKVDVDVPLMTGNKTKLDALAVIFGIESYKKVSGVTFARRDATIFKDYAVNVLGVPDNKSNIYFLTDDVTLGEFKKAFGANGWLARRIKPGSDVYIFYAGHGAPDIESKRGFLIPQDGDPNYANETGYPIDELYKFLENLNANSVTVFLDSCFSGANRENKMLLAQARPILVPVKVEVKNQNKLTVFSAASGSQISSGYPDKQHGLFTYFLLKGLRGEADSNGDKQLTTGELGRYLKSKVKDTAAGMDREQVPEIMGDSARTLVNYEKR